MNNSSTKNGYKHIFPQNNSFLSDMSHIQKSPKMGFSGNPSKTVELHNNRKSSEMVARGWYMTHFDRRDFLNSKKIGLGEFRDFSDL